MVTLVVTLHTSSVARKVEKQTDGMTSKIEQMARREGHAAGVIEGESNKDT